LELKQLKTVSGARMVPKRKAAKVIAAKGWIVAPGKAAAD
jgi:hypothetical protein